VTHSHSRLRQPGVAGPLSRFAGASLKSDSMPDENSPKIIYLPTTALVAVLLTVQAWFFKIYLFLGDKDQFKQSVCSGLAIGTTIFLFTLGRKAMRGGWPVKPGQKIGLTGLQACWVSILGIAGGVFHWWMLD
jgi:hypothetical protein